MAKVAKFKGSTFAGCTSNDELTKEEIQALNDAEGVTCYTITDQQYDEIIVQRYDASLDKGAVVTTKGSRATNFETTNNDKIYSEIGRIMSVKEAKQADSVDTTAEDQKIADLKTQLV